MHKLFMSLVSSGFVLVSGLVSCGRESRTPDVYRAAVPVFQTKYGTYPLREFNKQDEKKLDLQDSVDFSAAASKSIETYAECSRDGVNSAEHTRFTGVSRVQLWQLLPYEIKTAAINPETVCTFKFFLFNEAGSNTFYDSAQIRMTDTGEWPVRLESPGRSPLPQLLAPANLSGIRVRFPHAEAASAKVICEDAETPAIPFHHVVDAGNFDLFSVSPRPGRDNLTLERYPLQNCRVQISDAGRPIGLSGPYPMYLPIKRLEVTLVSDPPVVSPAEQISLMLGGAPNELAEWTVHNPSATARTIRLPLAKASSQVTIAYAGLAGIDGNLQLNMKATEIGVRGSQKPVYAQKSFDIKILPRETITVWTSFRASGRSNCVPQESTQAISIRNAEPFLAEVMTESGLKYDTIAFRTPDRSIVKSAPSSSAVYTNTTCRWD